MTIDDKLYIKVIMQKSTFRILYRFIVVRRYRSLLSYRCPSLSTFLYILQQKIYLLLATGPVVMLHAALYSATEDLQCSAFHCPTSIQQGLNLCSSIFSGNFRRNVNPNDTSTLLQCFTN